MTKRRTQRQRWSEADVELLRRNYADSATSDLAIALGRPVERVLAKANSLGLRKSRELIAELARERSMRIDHGGRATRFVKGQAPANKGVKRPEGWSPGRMAETQFKPGTKPKTWVPVGSLRIKDGYLERKVTDLPGSPSLRWHGVHRIVWEEANGPTPQGHVVVFKPGHHTTQLELITLEVVELVSRSELMRRNTRHNYGPEINGVITARACLTRAINKRSKEGETP